MLTLRLLTICGLCLSGCSIRPLPQDVTGYDTYEIVSKIRCEAREAVRGYTIEFIRKTRPDIADGLKSGAISFRNFNRRQLDAGSQRILERYDHSAIAYDFVFDITEKNDLTANATLIKPFTRGPLKIAFAAGDERERQNTRNFRITDTFENLVSVEDEYCKNASDRKNYLYPIVGKIGLDELIGAFLDLNQSGNLAGKEGSNVPTIADTIEFTTKFSGSVNPTIELSPVGRGLQLASAAFKADGSREDIHKVVVAVALPDDPTQRRAGRRTVRGTAKARANFMVDEQIYRKAIDDRRKVDERILRMLE
jgi:hypothetical protein